MKLPDSVLSLIAAGLQRVQTAPDGELPLGYREKIWTEMGARRSDTGRRRRARLAIAAARAVEHFWQRAHPADFSAAQFIEAAESALRLPQGDPGADALEEQANDFWLQLQGGDPGFAAISAAVMALNAAVSDESFNAADVDLERKDHEEIDRADASFFAAWALAGGRTFRKDVNVEARREFWRWWLQKAVPSAYESEGN